MKGWESAQDRAAANRERRAREAAEQVAEAKRETARRVADYQGARA